MAKDLKKPRDESRSRKLVATTIIVFSAIGLLASFMLSWDEIILLRDPDTQLSCSINAVLNCVSVMKTPQAEVFFGIPNSFFGMMAYPVLITIGVAILEGFRPRKWFLVCLQIAAIFGLFSALWMLFESIYAIQILCPWCLTVDLGMVVIFGAITHYNLRENTFGFRRVTYDRILRALRLDIDKVIYASILVLLGVLCFMQFGAALFA